MGSSAPAAGLGRDRRCAVLGSPVRHSLSPVLHRAAYEHLGLAWSYEAIEVDEDGLPGLVAGLDRTWRGLSLTMPLKRVALRLADRASRTARDVGAANTLVLEPDGQRVAHNTDVPGLVDALADRDVTALADVAVLGGGATATSAVAALARLGVSSPTVYARSTARAEGVREVGRRLGVHPVVRPWTDAGDALTAGLLVATTPAGATDELARHLADDQHRGVGGTPPVLFDVVYDPWPTALARAWAAAGGTVVGGLDLLVHQAVRQVRLFTGSDVPVDVLRAAGAAALAAREQP